MPFTDETTLREHTGLKNTTRIPSSLIVQRIADAHETLVADLDPAHAVSTDLMLRLGETELAAAYLLRSLATQVAFEETNLATAGLANRESKKSERLRALADEQEASAWARLKPYLRTRQDRFRFQLAEPSEPVDDRS